MAHKPPIVGSIVERKPTSSLSTPRPGSSAKTGFPTVQHRSKSAFARNREDSRKSGLSRSQHVPIISSVRASPASSPSPRADDWREQISKENEDRVAKMTDEEREQERLEILERFGANIGDVLKRARLARAKEQHANALRPVESDPVNRNPNEDAIPVTSAEKRPFNEKRAVSPPPSALVSAANSRPSSRADRRLRFAELEPDDVHVYESAPSSPKQRLLALPPPDATAEGSTVSLGKFRGKMVPQQSDQTTFEFKEPEEGTSEDIRRRFFPDAPKDDPNLAWMHPEPSDAASNPASSSLRFDLHGRPIPHSVSLTLPTHLGLHHHAEGTRAGYTLDDIFLLTRSTVPAQRATMMSILARIASHVTKMNNSDTHGMEELIGKEEDLRKRILAAGVEAMSDKGSVGAIAVEVVWECIVGWDLEFQDLEGVELGSSSQSTINSLPLEFFLPQITAILTQGGALPESSTQLLSIVHCLAIQSNDIADAIISTAKLLPTILQTFLLTPIPPRNSTPLPNPLALKLFHVLAQSSRSNAQEIAKLADSFLRFVSFSPFSSPFPPALATDLLVSTFDVYRVLASYGIYSHIAGTAMVQLSEVERYVISEACTSRALRIAWASLTEAWIVCALDPHQTTPPHDILWTQITGWAWHEGMMELQGYLDVLEKDWMSWSASWAVQSAWLEGSKVNAIKGGEAERLDFIDSVKSGFENGKEHQVVVNVLDAFQKSLTGGDVEQLKAMARLARVLASVIRLWLACIPPHVDGPPESPPFSLPFARLSELAHDVLTHPLWSHMISPDTTFGYVCCRDISGFLTQYLYLSRRLPGVSQSLWMAQAFSILLRLGTGDEDSAQTIIKDIFRHITPEWTAARKIIVSPLIWKQGGFNILEPFLTHIIRSDVGICISPLVITPRSIQSATTQRLPAPDSLQRLGLPLHRDWTTTPLNHLLRSGESAVFKALPVGWDSSETEVTRASLSLTKIAQRTLVEFSLTDFVLSREEAEFNCMKIFMLEHDQPQNDSSEEVFRDDIVNSAMTELLAPYAYDSAPAQATVHGDLEKIAQRFLGPSTPLFQFYTDFVALYDAISFSHPVFARLLIPLISMQYALDYRKHLWCDFNHVIRTIQLTPQHVLSADIREYLYPIETDPQVLAAYLSSLLKDNVNDFMRLVALHHVSSNIWPDLHEPDDVNEGKASSLLKAIVYQGGTDVVRQVVQYRQTASGKVLVPPACFGDLGEGNNIRSQCIEKWGGRSMVDKLQGLLQDNSA